MPLCGNTAGAVAIVHRARTCHHVNGIKVELSGDARLRFVLPKAEHAYPRYQNHSGAGVTHSWRCWQGMGFVVIRVFRTIRLQGRVDCTVQSAFVTARRVPTHKQRPDLCADEVIRAARTEMRQFRCTVGIHKCKHVWMVSETANDALLRTQATTQQGEHSCCHLLSVSMHAVLRATEPSHIVPTGLCGSMLLNELTDLIDDRDGGKVALALRLAPCKETMSAEHHAVAAGYRRHGFPQHHRKLKARPLPRHPHQLVAELMVELLHACLAIRACG